MSAGGVKVAQECCVPVLLRCAKIANDMLNELLSTAVWICGTLVHIPFSKR